MGKYRARQNEEQELRCKSQTNPVVISLCAERSALVKPSKRNSDMRIVLRRCDTRCCGNAESGMPRRSLWESTCGVNCKDEKRSEGVGSRVLTDPCTTEM